MNPELNDVGYVPSSPSLVQQDKPNPMDEAEISTLDEILALLANRKAYYDSTSSLSLDAAMLQVFSVNQQLAINKKVVFHIQELETKLASAINKVREKQSGREQ